jgi:hypothetical protein
MCLLYDQPDNFSVETLKKLAPARKIKRTRFDMGGFEGKMRLGVGQVIAVHYFLCGASIM